MPVFHLHIVQSKNLVPDTEGSAFPDLAAARDEAIRGARSLLSDEVLRGEMDLRQSIRIHDEAGRHLETVRFDEAVRLTSADPDEQGAPSPTDDVGAM